jgi:hypothetical protein
MSQGQVEMHLHHIADVGDDRELKEDLATTGIRSKRRLRLDGTEFGQRELARGALYGMLQNRIYRGEITHKGNSYPGEHPAIIDQQLWDEVQELVVKNRVERATGARAKYPSLLGGLVFDTTGRAPDADIRDQEGNSLSVLHLGASDAAGQNPPLTWLAYSCRRFGKSRHRQAPRVPYQSHLPPRSH